MNDIKVSFLLDAESNVYLHHIAELLKKQDCLKLILQARWWKMLCSCWKEMRPVKSKKRWWEYKNQFYYCSRCKCQRSLLRWTIFFHTKVPLHKWFSVIYEMTINTHWISHLNVAKKVGVNVKTAKRMCMKIRERLIKKVVPKKDEMTWIVEVDETYMASKKLWWWKGWGSSRRKVVGAVSRDSGKVYLEQIENIDEKSLCWFIDNNVSEWSHICSDELRGYQPISKRYNYTHSTVCHSKREYVRYDEDIKIKTHTNSIEGAWSHVEKFINWTLMDVWHKFIKEYLAEFMMRYNFRKTKNLWWKVVCWCCSCLWSGEIWGDEILAG